MADSAPQGAMERDKPVTALCDQLDDVRAAVRRQVWGADLGGAEHARAGATDAGQDDGTSLRQLKEQEGGLRVVRELRTKSRAYTRLSRHPSVSPLAAAAAHDAGLGVKPRYGQEQRIPYPRELLNDPGILTRARKRRAATRRARSVGTSETGHKGQPFFQHANEQQSIELVVSCAELEGVPSAQQRLPNGAELAVCVQARLLLWRNGYWELHGSTEPVRHGQNPCFAKTFLVRMQREMLEEGKLSQTDGPSTWEAEGKCRVELHYRWGARATDPTHSPAGEALIGHMEFLIPRLLATPGQCLAERLDPSGRLAVRAVFVTAGLHQHATLRLRASLSASNSIAPIQPDTSASYFFTVSREIGSTASALSPYELIGRSENIVGRRTATLGCRDLSLSVHKLCYGNFETRLKVEVFQYDPLGQHKLVGNCTFRPVEALRFPAPIGSPSSHLRVQTMSLIDVSCVSDNTFNSSRVRLGSRPTSPIIDEDSDYSRRGLDEMVDEDQISNDETDQSSTADPSETKRLDPFSTLHCSLYSPAASSSSADQVVVGSVRVSLGVSQTKEIPSTLLRSGASSRTTQKVTDADSTTTQYDDMPMLHESLDGAYMRAIMCDETLVRTGDQAEHVEHALCHLAERRSAMSRLAELQRRQRSTTSYLQQSLNSRTTLRRQLRADAPHTFAESPMDRDARLFARFHSGVERERWLESQEQQAEELGEIKTILSQPRRRWQQETQVQQELSELVRTTRLSAENDHSYSMDGCQQHDGSPVLQPIEAVEEALAQVTQSRCLMSKNAAAGSWTSCKKEGISIDTTSQSRLNKRSSSVNEFAQQRQMSDNEEHCNSGGFLQASLLFTEALNAQLDPRTAHQKNVTRPRLLQVSGMQSA